MSQPIHSDVMVALKLAKAALEPHEAPGSCWATGPLTGDPVKDLVECPGCRALAAIAKAEESAQ